jgi:hypothetical protein
MELQVLVVDYSSPYLKLYLIKDVNNKNIMIKYRSFKASLFAVLAVLNFIFFSGCEYWGDITIPSGATDLSVNIKADDNAVDNPADIVVITEAKALITDNTNMKEKETA